MRDRRDSRADRSSMQRRESNVHQNQMESRHRKDRGSSKTKDILESGDDSESSSKTSVNSAFSNMSESLRAETNRKLVSSLECNLNSQTNESFFFQNFDKLFFTEKKVQDQGLIHFEYQ